MKKTAGYIGLDVGSSGCKAAVLDQKGNILTEKRREYSFEYPAKGRVELNPVTVWNCVKEVLADEDKECAAAVAPVQAEMDEVNKQRTDLKKKQEGKKDEDIPTAEKDKVNELDKKWDELKTQKEGIFADYAAKNKVVRQLIDLALLQNGMLKGEALNNFVKRSIDLIK